MAPGLRLRARVSKKQLWLLPLGLAILLGAAILALPGFVASSTHRGTIEALASSLTGRTVRGQRQAVARLAARTAAHRRAHHHHRPRPGDDQAGSLTLARSLPALLHGRLHATSLTLISPQSTCPGRCPAAAPPSPRPAGSRRCTRRSRTVPSRSASGTSQCERLDRHRRRQRHHRLRQRCDARPIAVPLWRSPAPTPTATRRCGSMQKAATQPAFPRRAEHRQRNHRRGRPHRPACTNPCRHRRRYHGADRHHAAGQCRSRAARGNPHSRFPHPAPELKASLTGQNLDASALNAVPALSPGMQLKVALNATNVTAFRQQSDLPGGLRHGRRHVRPARCSPACRAAACSPASADRREWRGQRQGQAAIPLLALLHHYGIPAPAGWTSAALSTTLSGTRASPRYNISPGRSAATMSAGS